MRKKPEHLIAVHKGNPRNFGTQSAGLYLLPDRRRQQRTCSKKIVLGN
jgi:hypothetical protein